MSPADGRRSGSGEDLEREVARIYGLLGAQTEQRILIDHYEIDVRAVLRAGPFRLAFVVECKEYLANQAVSDTDMEKFVVKVGAARERGLADKGVFVTTSTFSKNARATAARHGIQCLQLRDLRNQLIDFGPYLNEIVREFDASNLGRWYVDQTVSEFEDYDALSNADRASVLHAQAIQYVDHRFGSLREPRIALLGNFGTGKSSFCLAYRAHLARAALADPLARVPLLVDLRDFRAGLDIQQVIANTLQRLRGVEASLPVCLELQRQGRFLFLLDGLDEMATRIDRTVINESLQEIDRLRSAGDNRYVLTCRTHFFQERVLDEFLTDYDVLYLTEWTTPQIESYFTKRFGAQGHIKSARILSHARIAELARTPLLLDILLETGEIDEQNIDVYGLLTRYTDGWICKQTKRRGAIMTSTQRRRFVLALASHMYTKNLRRIHFSELYEVAREFCGHRDASRVDHFDADARTCTFITKDSTGNYSFRYQAFEDYFSAVAIAEGIEAGQRELLGSKGLSAEIVELIVGRRILDEGRRYLQAWAAEFSHERLSSNSVRLLTTLGDTVPKAVLQHHRLSDQGFAEIGRRDDLRLGRWMTEIVARYGPSLRRDARRFARSMDIADSEDAVANAFAKLWVLLQDPNGKMADADVKGYLMRMIRNELLDRARAERRGRSLIGPVNDLEVLIGQDQMNDAASASYVDEVAKAVQRMDPEYRSVFEQVLAGASVPEIGAKMKLTPRQVRMRVRTVYQVLLSVLGPA